jgi:hypothetical protein
MGDKLDRVPRPYKYVVCNKCDYVAFEVTREYAEDEVTRFNEYFDSLTKDQQDDYYNGNKASIVFYEHCFNCNNRHSDFREATDKDHERANGHTLQPVINRNETNTQMEFKF